MTGIPLLSAFYFGSVEHYALLARHARVIIDIGEHYERQSYRTRTSIIGPNGVQHLNVQIARDHGNKMAMRSVGLSYVESWPQQHLHAIRSAYGQTPWFIHYVDDIEALLLRKYDRLVDLDLATMHLALKWLGLKTHVVVSETYVEGGVCRLGGDGCGPVQEDTPENERVLLHDLRSTFQPKRPMPAEVPAVRDHPQAFAERHGHVSRLSIIDLVCNTGPQARGLLTSM
ncbi:MAG: WbqC family protein [Flavobacteriales bacterium]|nr:WbqC family protein [Flavobacteriales bacterium]